MHQLFFPNGFEKTKVRWEKIKIKLAHNVRVLAVRWQFKDRKQQKNNKH
jgi:hypothetical protein